MKDVFKQSGGTKVSMLWWRWGFILLGIIIMMFLGTVYAYSVFRSALEVEFHIGRAESGLPYMFALAFYALLMFISGRFIEKFHPKRVILVGGSLVVLGWLLSSFSNNIFLLTITYGCIGGAGVGITYGVLMNLTAKWFPDQKGLAVGLVLIGFGLSPLVTAPVVKHLVESFGVMDTFFMMGIGFGILLPFLAYPFRYPAASELAFDFVKSKSQAEDREIPLKEMVKKPSFKGIYINYLIGTMIGLTMVGMTTQIGTDYIGVEAHIITKWVAVFAIFNGLGRPLFGWITDRFSSKFSMLFSYLLIMIAAIFLLLWPNQKLPSILALCLFWFNLGGWLAIAPTSTLKFYGTQNYSENYGLVFTAYGLGAIVGVTSTGMLVDAFGSYQYLFVYILALCSLGIGLTLRYMGNISPKV